MDRRRACCCVPGRLGTSCWRNGKRRKDDSTAIIFLEQLVSLCRKRNWQRSWTGILTREILFGCRRSRRTWGRSSYMVPNLERLAHGRGVLTVKRSASASPATGSHKAHEMEQHTLISHWRLAGRKRRRAGRRNVLRFKCRAGVSVYQRASIEERSLVGRRSAICRDDNEPQSQNQNEPREKPNSEVRSSNKLLRQ
jgi:hypothetical protein